jgi:REP-associated tyrosine transposase
VAPPTQPANASDLAAIQRLARVVSVAGGPNLRTDLDSFSVSHSDGRAGWWKSPSPDLGRAPGASWRPGLLDRGVHSEVSQEDVVPAAEEILGGGVSQVGAAEGEPNRGGASDIGSRAHDDRDTAEIRGVAGGGIHKGKSAIHPARVYGERKRSFVGQHFWGRGYFVSTVGRDEEVIRQYIRNQEREDERLDQMNLLR